MRKRLAAFLGTLCILTGIIPVSSAEFTDIEDNKYSIAINTVCGLGLMEETEHGVFSPDAYVTRGEVAVAVGKLMKYDWYFDDETTFSDVPHGAEEAGYINTLKTMGIMLGYDETYFGYEDAVTLEQFETIILRATGYMSLEGILSRSQMLSQADFLDGVHIPPQEKLTRADMAQLLYNCLEIEEVYDNYQGGYFTGKTVLEERQGLKEIKGVVTANSITRLSSSGGVGKGHIEIDSVEYETTYPQADELLGYPVVAYCDIEDNIIKYMYDIPSKYEIIEVPDYDIEYIDTDGANVTIKYEYNSKMKMEVLNIADNVLYNGTAIRALTNEALNINMGKMKIIELDNGVRNIFIESYVDYVVEYVNTDEKTIVDKMTRQIVSFDYKDSIKFYKFGYETTFDQIKDGEVLSVYDNNDSNSRNIVVYVSDDKETGKITGIDEDLVYINGKTYHMAAGTDLTNEYISGFIGSFYIDASGRIVGADNASDTGLQYGCLVKIQHDWSLIYDSNGENKFLTFKILGTNGQVVEYPASKKLRVNDVKVYKDWENFPIGLFKQNGKYYNQLVKFQIDYEGKITAIYTENQNFDDSPKADSSNFADYRYRSKSGAMYCTNTMMDTNSPGFFVDASTVIFSVPSEYTGIDEDYKVMNVSAFREMATYYAKSYDMNEYSVSKALMITSSNKVLVDSPMVGVDDTIMVLSSDMEAVPGIKAVGGNKVAKYEIHPLITTPIKKGDIMQIGVDEDGKVNAVSVVANAESISELIPVDDFHNDYAIGTIYGVSGDYLRLDFANNTSLSVKLTNATQYCIYRKDRQKFELADKKSMSIRRRAVVQILNGYAVSIFVVEE